MMQNKCFPWLNEKTDGFLFNRDAPIDDVIARRDFFDYDYGLRFRGESIRERNWTVGFFLEGCIDYEEELESFFHILHEIGEVQIFAIPSKEVGVELSGKHDVLEFFNPPLIAVGDSNIQSFFQIRSSMVQMLRGSFFVFPKNDSVALLCSNGKYKMLAGPRLFVEKALGKSIEKSWDPVREKNGIDPLLISGLQQAMIAYGIDM